MSCFLIGLKAPSPLKQQIHFFAFWCLLQFVHALLTVTVINPKASVTICRVSCNIKGLLKQKLATLKHCYLELNINAQALFALWP